MLTSLPLHPVLLPCIVGLLILLQELVLLARKRSQHQTSTRLDRSSLALLWGTNLATILLAIPIGWYHIPPELYFHLNYAVILLIFVLLMAGMFLRFWSVFTLGAYFTVNVAIHREHRVISHGPYALVRHPSYTGLLLEIVALAVSYQHFVSLLIIMVPAIVMVLVRIAIEEHILKAHFGHEYKQYYHQTYALVPYLY